MNLLAAVDLSATSDRVVEQARGLALALGGRLWLLHVAEPEPEFVGHAVDSPEMRDVLASHFHQEHRELQRISGELRAAGIACDAILTQGVTADTILTEAARLGAEMILVGSHGKGMVYRLLLGSTSEEVLRRSALPVLVVPAREG